MFERHLRHHTLIVDYDSLICLKCLRLWNLISRQVKSFAVSLLPSIVSHHVRKVDILIKNKINTKLVDSNWKVITTFRSLYINYIY